MPSLQSRLIALILQLTRKRSFRSEAGLQARLAKVRPSEDHRPPEKIARRLQITQHQVQGWPVYEVRPAGGGARRLLYLHGGAFCFEIAAAHWDLIAELAERLDAQVTVPIYPLAPEQTCAVSWPMLQQVWQDVASAAPTFDVIGDSAGGNLALVLQMMAAAQNGPRAASLVLLSPCVDMTLRHPEIPAYAARDPWLATTGALAAVRLYAGDVALDDWRISPTFGDLASLPRTLIFIGTHELLYPDAIDFAKNARAAGVPLELVEAEGMFHVWPLVTLLPESRPARERIIGFLTDPSRPG